jgi:rod shape determining protein RodA
VTTLGALGAHRRTSSSGLPPWRRVDLVLLVATLAVASFGTLMVFSATRGNGDTPDTSYLDRQMTYAFVGLGLMALVSAIDYRQLRELVVLAYGGMLVVLLAVPFLGVEVNGARAWFRFGPIQLQPAEFGKIVIIVALAAFFTIDRSAPSGRQVLVALGIVGVPAALIMLQPDLGTVLVYVAITAAVFVVSGVRARQIAVLGLVVVLGTVGVLNSGVLDDYQVNRLTAFVDNKPSKENKAVFEQQTYAETAIGNGGLLGRGLFDGEQKQAALVREKQTDFIFTVVGEELGFAGSAVLLGLYGVMILRIWRVGSTAPDLFGTLICTGVLAMIMFQVFESIGMSTGIMPITGIPLPFFSYGGSSVLASFLGIGLVQSVHLRRVR